MGRNTGGERADDQRHPEPAGVSAADGSQDEARKKIAATDAIFENVARVNQAADANPKALRISIDSKAAVAVGDFSRDGQSRVSVKALDHDMQSKEKLIPFGILAPKTGALAMIF